MNPYETLGVKIGDKDAAKRAFRDLAKKYHPDKNPGDSAAEEKFKEISNAWESIKSGDADVEPISAFWRQSNDRYWPYQKPKNPTLRVNASLEELYSGTTKSVNIGGEVIDVVIPPRSSPGLVNTGDMYVVVSCLPHQTWSLVGNNIAVKFPINILWLSVGTVIQVPLPDGEKVKIEIPAGTDPNTKFRVRGKGLKSYTGGIEVMGSLIVELLPRTPVLDGEDAATIKNIAAKS